MFDLLIRTLSQGLQGFLPVAFALAWFHRAGTADRVSGLRWGILAAVPVTFAAMFLFERVSRQSLWEAALAGATLGLAIWFARQVQRPSLATRATAATSSNVIRIAFALGATLLIVRQTMEIAVGLGAALELRARDPLLAIVEGVALALTAALVWRFIAKRLDSGALAVGTALFAVLFAAQAALYAFHESAESGLLPWSDVLHAATEPYGPDGIYGRYVSLAGFALPIAAAFAARMKRRLPGQETIRRPLVPYPLVVGVAVMLVAGIELMSVVSGERGSRAVVPPVAAQAPRGVTAIAASPHLIFRHTAVDRNYSRLSVAPLGARTADDRAPADVVCDRVSYAAGRGLCLTADRGMFTTYKALLLNSTLQVTREIKLAGSPSRTRISPDGRVGAITVFATGATHQYTGSAFSTKTTIVDMASGDELGDLESFTTWKDGSRFKATDFNFWGVTFARDGNTFYATLKTAGKTYLVRGDLGLRKLTVLKENVECPALSPDNRLIGFKKRIGTGQEPWRFYVLDLATLTERPIAGETRSVDDQLEWLDDAQVLYGVPRADRPSSRDVWVAAVDGKTPARIFLPDAESPIVIR